MKLKKIVIRVIIVLFLLICLILAFFYRASAQARKEQKEVTKLAVEYANLVDTQDFYWYNGNSTYYTITGINDKNQDILVTVPKKEGKIIIQNQANGITKDEAISKVEKDFHPIKITKVEFGYYKDQPIWEVTTQNKAKQLSYYILDFKNGNVIHKVENF